MWGLVDCRVIVGYCFGVGIFSEEFRVVKKFCKDEFR